jgi:hypothetical protein
MFLGVETGRFGNWICFRRQARWGPLERANLDSIELLDLNIQIPLYFKITTQVFSSFVCSISMFNVAICIQTIERR